jgi:polyisoprenoid-binding protein YceI
MKYLFFIFFSIAISAQQLRVNSDVSKITYEASHPIHDWSGTSEDINGVVVLKDDIPSRMAIAISVASFDSNNSNRDAHALEVLDALLFPKVSLYAEDFEINNNKLLINGDLKFHGKTIKINTSANWSKIRDLWILEGEFDFKPSDFEITLPSFMLVKMRDLIHISFRLELRTFTP